MITPMVARLVSDPFDREGWLFELKWDGFRAIAERDHGGHVSIYSRNHKDFSTRFPPIVEALSALKRPAILDGEPFVYYAFDLLMLDGKGLRQLSLVKANSALPRFLTGHPRLLDVEHIEKEGLAMFAGALALGLEGIVAKEGKSPYVEGRHATWHWQKIKSREYKRQGKVEFGQSRGKV